jgi:putative ABC transport system permease protein
VGLTGIGVSTHNQTSTGVNVPGRDEPISIGNYNIDDGFFRTMGIRLIAGRELSRNRPLDLDPRPYNSTVEQDREIVARGVNVVANELAVRRLGFTDPSRAVGRTFGMGIADEEAGLVPITIVGVVRDTRFRSISEPIEPIIYRLSDGGITHMVVRYDSGQANAVRDQIGQVWRRLVPDVPFNAEFSEEIVAELYNAEAARAKVFAGFALLAVIVACLGLFGLAAFTAERRTKEIGIRKVFGARSQDIVKLLAWQFSKPVMIANLIAWPVAWWVMRDWLDGFETRIDLGPAPFLVAGLLALAIAIGTVSGHALRVSRTNPIHALRYE